MAKMWSNWKPHALLMGMQTRHSYWKTVVPKRLKIELSHDPAIAFLSICRKDLKAGCRRVWLTVFASALFSVKVTHMYIDR